MCEHIGILSIRYGYGYGCDGDPNGCDCYILRFEFLSLRWIFIDQIVSIVAEYTLKFVSSKYFSS